MFFAKQECVCAGPTQQRRYPKICSNANRTSNRRQESYIVDDPVVVLRLRSPRSVATGALFSCFICLSSCHVGFVAARRQAETGGGKTLQGGRQGVKRPARVRSNGPRLTANAQHNELSPKTVGYSCTIGIRCHLHFDRFDMAIMKLKAGLLSSKTLLLALTALPASASA